MNCSTVGLACAQRNSGGLRNKIMSVSLARSLPGSTLDNAQGNDVHAMNAKQFLQLNNDSKIINNKGFSTGVDACKTSKNHELAAKIIEKSDIVCLDVDSTVICEEGIDELADFCGKGSEVAKVTKDAMGGAMTFQDALKIRLNIIKPSQRQIMDFIKQRPSTLTANVKKFIERLKSNGKDIYLISGGFDCLIEPVATELGIPHTQIFANKLMFYCNGEYASFDTTQPTSKSGGKADAIGLIRHQSPSALITMIGDGATDLEAVPPANYFIGFGGNVIREEVYKRAQYYITDFNQLM